MAVKEPHKALRSFSPDDLTEAEIAEKALCLLVPSFTTAEEVYTHFSGREAPLQPELPEPDIDDAGRILENIFTFYGETHSKGENIRWENNPGNDHWQHDMNRFSYLDTLVSAHVSTGDDRYAAKGAALILDWISKTDVRYSGFFIHGNAWNYGSPYVWMSYLNIAIHLEYWTRHFEQWIRFWSPEELMLVLKSVHDQLAYLELVIPTMTNNFIVIGSNSMIQTAARLPELRDRDRFMEYAWEKLEHAAEQQVLADGVQFELTQSYHMVVLSRFCSSVRTCRELELPGSEKVLEKTGAMLDYYADMITPDGLQVAFNDSDPNAPRKTAAFRLLSEEGEARNRPHWIYAATGRKSGTPPEELSRAYPCGGVYVMRNGYGSESSYLVFDGGPWGKSHQHDDKLSFWFAAYGKSLIVDPGRYLYDQHNPYSGIKYLNTSRAHSTITVDGETQADRWFPETHVPKDPVKDHTWTDTEDFTRAAATHSLGYGEQGRIQAEHRRSITLFRQGFLLILDRVTGKGKHAVDSRLQFHPGEVREQEGMWIYTRDSVSLAVVPVFSSGCDVRIEKGQLDPVSGWYSPRINCIEPCPTMVVHAETDLPCRSGFLLVPFRGDSVPEAGFSLESDDVHFHIGKDEQTLSFDDMIS